MASTIDTARFYLENSPSLRSSLGIASTGDCLIEPLGQGEHNANFALVDRRRGKSFVLRVNYVSQMGLNDQIGYEFEALHLLEGSQRTPKPLFVDGSRSIIENGVLAESFCTGQQLDYRQPEDVRAAARILADIHATPVPEDCRLSKPADPLKEQFGECRRLFAAYTASDLADPFITDAVERFFEATAAALDMPGCPQDRTHIVNTEAVSDHFLIDREKGSGFMVDWEKPIIGEVAQDVAYFLAPTTTIWKTDFVFTPEEREAFVSEYWQAVGNRFPRGSFDTRYQAFLMSNNLRGITWSCNAWVEYHDPCRPLKNADTFERLKIYLSRRFVSFLAKTIFHTA